MFYRIASCLIVLVVALIIIAIETKDTTLYVETPPVAEHYIGKVRLNNNVVIRLLVLKHCPDDIADTDANQAVQAANLAATKGLSIQDIGNYHVDKDGMTQTSLVWGKKCSLSTLKEFISKQMQMDAEPGDTLVVYTIGHGSGDGTVTRLGERSQIMQMLAECAEENDQETLWWQLSCYAAAGLPKISTLNERQQELFSMTASSPANRVSYFCTQGEIMQKVFVAIAERNKTIDPDQDEIITAGELSRFLNSISAGRGDLVYAKNSNEPIFGWNNLANRIPIIGPEGPEDHGNRYIPYPKWRKKLPIPTKGID